MPKIQLNLSEREDMVVGVYKVAKKLPTKEAAIKNMIEYFEISIKPKNRVIEWLKSDYSSGRNKNEG
jgi:hypothetical protein